jgi:regulatory protein
MADSAREGKLEVGQELSDSQLKALITSDRYRRCLDAATRLLSYRPRSEAELRQRLSRTYDSDCLEKVLETLKDKGLVDDEAFARFWKDNRESFSPRSRYLTVLELRRKGVDGETISKVVSEIDDGEAAYQAALRWLRKLAKPAAGDDHRRLGEYLRRRGFSYEVIRNTIEKISEESGEDTRS